ncbi:MAG: carboxylesterase family protein [Deltaproteobacteria bacterium]|nr:carboxylesterase family protein [Deltaproteobacteria bacterium]
MLDIILSLEWVKANIKNFGGDPDNVTIFGESGGGRKVAMLMAMVPTKGFIPCVDGITLKRKPFIPDAPAISADIPLMIGSNKDEMSIFRVGNPKFGKYTNEDFQAHVKQVLPEKIREILIKGLHGEP